MLANENITLRQASTADSAFILELANQPAWKQYIGDHAIGTESQAQEYIEQKLHVMYKSHGFGLWVVETLDNSEAVGLCGLIKRDSLEYIDLGFAFLPKFWGKGFARQASELCLQYAFNTLNAPKVLAITNPNNHRCIRLLECLHFDYVKNYSHPESNEVLALYELYSHQGV